MTSLKRVLKKVSCCRKVYPLTLEKCKLQSHYPLSDSAPVLPVIQNYQLWQETGTDMPAFSSKIISQIILKWTMITKAPIMISKINISARTDNCWLLDSVSAVSPQLTNASPDSHILLVIKGRDGLWTENKPWRGFYKYCGMTNISVLFSESPGRLLGEPMTGWNGFEDGTTQLWCRFELSGIIDAFNGTPPTKVYERLLKRWGIDGE